MLPPPEPLEGPILQTKEIVKAFGGLKALDACTLSVRPRTITGLIGPNGAGKSTLFNTIMGLYAPDAGEVYFNGERIDGQPSYRIVQKGLAKTFQIPRELRNLTVLENLMISAKDLPGEHLPNLFLFPHRVKAREREAQGRAEELLEFVGLSNLRDEYAKNLSGGQKKLLELSRALMSNPTLLLLDEPVAGVNPTLTLKILEAIADLKRQGRTIFLIEHDMEVVMNRCDWILVLHQGRKLAEGVPQTVKQDAQVVEAYLGQ